MEWSEKGVASKTLPACIEQKPTYIKQMLAINYIHWTETYIVRLSFSIAFNLKIVSIDRACHVNIHTYIHALFGKAGWEMAAWGDVDLLNYIK